MSTYNPTKTKGILPEGYAGVKEALAAKIHDTWAAGRIEQGWTYGPARNDELKQHPCLVPFDELSEDEKAFDYATAEETILTLTELGYEIVKKGWLTV